MDQRKKRNERHNNRLEKGMVLKWKRNHSNKENNREKIIFT